MRDLWTNTTWANWLQSHKVEQGHHALLEVNGYGHPKKIMALAKRGEDLFNLIPIDKRWTIVSWHSFGGYAAISSLHPSPIFLKSLKKKKKK